MKRKTRNLLIIIVTIIVMAALAIADISNNGALTTGFLGMVVLLLGTVIIPTSIELIRGKFED
ncbi:MAG: hypothetical protein ACOYWZ_05260 [Bacillota bacterium]